MTIKWDRESILVILMALAILFGIFFYGYGYFVEPVKEEANRVTERVEIQQSLVTSYQPSEENLAEFQTLSTQTEEFLPVGDAANEALITLGQRADGVNVNIQSVSREAYQEVIEEMPAEFVKNTYVIEMSSNSPANFRRLIDALIDEARIWNIHVFSYSKVDDENYTSSMSVDLPYYTTTPIEETETTEEE